MTSNRRPKRLHPYPCPQPAGQSNYFGLTSAGRVRSQNEDAFHADPELGLYLVADGMGAESAGALAAKIVVEVLPMLVRNRMGSIGDLSGRTAKRRIQATLAELSVQLRQKTQSEPNLAGMGAAVVLALVREDQALVAHLGDSRAYLFRQRSLDQLTKDHSLAQLLVDSGDITPDEARSHSARHRLTRYVGMAGEPSPAARSFGVRDGDSLLLCSDGLTAMVSDASIFSILKEGLRPKETCELLIAAANEGGGADNITALVVGIGAN